MAEEVDMSSVVAVASGSEPAEGLRAVVALRRLADRLESSHVRAARRAGWSWAEIGDALGISRQAAHKKYRKEL